MSNNVDIEDSAIMILFNNYIEDPLFNVRLSFIDKKDNADLMQSKNILTGKFKSGLNNEIKDKARKLSNYDNFSNNYLKLVKGIGGRNNSDFDTINPLNPKNIDEYEESWREFEDIFREMNKEYNIDVANLKDMFSAFSYQTKLENKISLCGFDTVKKLYQEFYVNGLLVGNKIDAYRFYNTFVDNSYWKNYDLKPPSDEELKEINKNFGKKFYNFDESLWNQNKDNQGRFTKRGKDSFANFGNPNSQPGFGVYGGGDEWYQRLSWTSSLPSSSSRQPIQPSYQPTGQGVPLNIRREYELVDYNKNMMKLLDKDVNYTNHFEKPPNSFSINQITNNSSGQRGKYKKDDFEKLKKRFEFETQKKLRLEIIHHLTENIFIVIELIKNQLERINQRNNLEITNRVKQSLRTNFVRNVKSKLSNVRQIRNNSSSITISSGRNNLTVESQNESNSLIKDLNGVKKVLENKSAGLFNDIISGYYLAKPDKEETIFINFMFYLYAYYRKRSLIQLLTDYNNYNREVTTTITQTEDQNVKKIVTDLSLKTKMQSGNFNKISSYHFNSTAIHFDRNKREVIINLYYHYVLKHMFKYRNDFKQQRQWDNDKEKEFWEKAKELRNKEFLGKNTNANSKKGSVNFWDNLLMGQVAFEGQMKQVSVPQRRGGMFDRKSKLEKSVTKNIVRYEKGDLSYRPFVFALTENKIPYLIDVIGLAKLKRYNGEVNDIVFEERDGKKYYNDSFPVIRLSLPKGKTEQYEGLFSMNLLYFLSNSEKFYLDVPVLETGGVLTKTVIKSKVIRPLVIQGFSKSELIKQMKQRLIEFFNTTGDFENLEKNRKWCFKVLFGDKLDIVRDSSGNGREKLHRVNGNGNNNEVSVYYPLSAKLSPFIFGVGANRAKGVFGMFKKEIKNNMVNTPKKGFFGKIKNKVSKFRKGLTGKIYTSDIIKKVQERLNNIEKTEVKYSLQHQNISVFSGRYISRFDAQKMMMWWYGIQPVLKYVIPRETNKQSDG